MGTPLDVTEWMRGFIGAGASDSDEGYMKGVADKTPFMHEVVIRIDDIDRFIAEPSHTATMDGSVDSPIFGGRRTFTGGTFNMLVDTRSPDLKVMLYRIPFVDAHGAPHTMLGNKTIRSDSALDLLNDIMRLTVRIFEGDVPGPAVETALGPADMPATPKAIGVIHIQLLDGIRSGLSFDSPGADVVEQTAAIGKFGRFYLGKLWDVYGKTIGS